MSSKDDPTELDLTIPEPGNGSGKPGQLRVPSPTEIQRAVDQVETIVPPATPPLAPSKPAKHAIPPGTTSPVDPPRMFDPDRTMREVGFANAPSHDPTTRERVPPPPHPVDLTAPTLHTEAPRSAGAAAPGVSGTPRFLVPALVIALAAAIAVIVWLLIRGG